MKEVLLEVSVDRFSDADYDDYIKKKCRAQLTEKIGETQMVTSGYGKGVMVMSPKLASK